MINIKDYNNIREYFNTNMKESVQLSHTNEYGATLAQLDTAFWRSLDAERVRTTGLYNFIKEYSNGKHVRPEGVKLTVLNFNKYFVNDYTWDQFIQDLTDVREQILQQVAEQAASNSLINMQMSAITTSNTKLVTTELQLFTSAKFNMKYSKADDYFIFDNLFKDSSNNLYFKIGKEYFLLKFKNNEERVLSANTLEEDSNFWSAFFTHFEKDFNKWNVTIMRVIEEAFAKSDTTIEEQLISAGVPRIYIESLKVSAVVEYITHSDGKKTVTIKNFKQCVIVPNTGATKSTWRYADIVIALSKNIIQSVDITRVKKIAIFSNDVNEPALLHINIPVAQQHDSIPQLPAAWSKFLNDERFYNPIMNRFKIAKFILNTLDAHYSGRQALVLSGEGYDGKGVFLDVLSQMLSDDLSVSLNVSAFNAEDRFELAAIHNKKFIMLPDCKYVSKLFATDKFKQVTGHDKLTLENKFAKPISYRATNSTIAVATNNLYYVNMEHGRTRVLPIVFRKNYDKKSFIDKLTMESMLLAEKSEFLQWCVDYVEYMKTTYPGCLMQNNIVNCADADLDKLDTLSDEELFINACKSELLKGEPCCKWNERTTDEDADDEVLAEVLDEKMTAIINSFGNTASYFTVREFITELNEQLEAHDQSLRMVLNGSVIKMSRSNTDYKRILEYLKNTNKVTFKERAHVNNGHIRNVLFINAQNSTTAASSTATPAQKFSKRVNPAIFEDEPAPSIETIITAQFDNKALADIVKNESVEVKNRVFKAVKDAGRDLTTVTADELATFVNAAKSALAKLNAEVESKDDFYSHLKYNPNIQV